VTPKIDRPDIRGVFYGKWKVLDEGKDIKLNDEELVLLLIECFVLLANEDKALKELSERAAIAFLEPLKALEHPDIGEKLTIIEGQIVAVDEPTDKDDPTIKDEPINDEPTKDEDEEPTLEDVTREEEGK
jgi:hypothetical protein